MPRPPRFVQPLLDETRGLADPPRPTSSVIRAAHEAGGSDVRSHGRTSQVHHGATPSRPLWWPLGSCGKISVRVAIGTRRVWRSVAVAGILVGSTTISEESMVCPRRTAFLLASVLLGCATAGGPQAYNPAVVADRADSITTLAQIYFWRAKPGKLEEYTRYIREHAEPIDNEARRAGAFLSVTTYMASDTTVP